MITRLMTHLMRPFRVYPGWSAFVALLIIVLASMSAQMTWAIWAQPDPQVLSRADPLANTGVDAKGSTLDQWIATGNTPDSYKPVIKTTFRAGDTLWILRFDCFLNKTQDSVVSRAFLGGDGSAGTNRSVYSLPDMQIPTRTDGCAVKNHRTLIPTDLPSGQWTYQATVNFYKSPLQPSVRVLFKPVLITIR